MVSEELGMPNKHIKQYYTPHEVSSLIAKIVDVELGKGISAPTAVDIIDEKGYINVFDKTTPRLIQFHTFKNAANPPFLGGFSIFSIVAA